MQNIIAEDGLGSAGILENGQWEGCDATARCLTWPTVFNFICTARLRSAPVHGPL